MQIDLLTRSGTTEPTSVDQAARTVRVVWSTGADVGREDYKGRYLERLSMQPGQVRLDRLQGASVLDNHNRFGVRSVLGVVKAADVTNGVGSAVLEFSSRADVEPIWQDIMAGIVRHVSVGYSVDKWTETTDATTGARTRTAVSWTPREISFVALSADAGAHVRSEQVEPENTGTSTDGELNDRAAVNVKIRKVAQVAGLPASFADALIDRGASVKQARAAAFKEMQRTAGAGGVILSQMQPGGASNDDPSVMRERMSEALACRVMPGSKPSDQARQFMQLSMTDMARTLLEARGERTGLMAREEIINTALRTRAAGAATVSDFADLLTGTGNRVLRAAYEAAPNPLKALCREVTMPDFRPRNLLQLSEMPKLMPVTEQGEIKSVSRSDGKESYSLGTFGQIFSLSRKAITNDDLNSFADWSTAMGKAASETEAGELVNLLTANSGVGPTMATDSVALFNSAHGNLAGSGAVISIATLTAARLAMRRQKGLDGVTPINATAAYLLVPPEQETLADQVLTAIFAATTAAANPFVGALTKQVEARLTSTTAWYLFADPGVLPVLEYGYLASAQGPQMASRQGWEVLGVEFRCVLDFGCGAVDWRGVFRNPGA